MKFTVLGSTAFGFCVAQLVEGEWLSITKRYATYDEAAESCRHIEEDNSEIGKSQ